MTTTMNRDKKKSYLYLFLYGLVSSLAFAPTYLFFIFFFSFNFLLDNLDKTHKTESFIIGWMFGFGYFIGNCYWYCSSLLIEPLKYAWLIPFAITVIPAYLAIYIGFTTMFTSFSKKFINNRLLLSLLFSIFWTFFEYARGIILTGFPWNLIGYSLAFSPLAIQTVSFFGSYIFGFFVILIYTSYWVLNDNKYNKYSGVYLLIISFAIIYGKNRLEGVTDEFSEYIIRLVQPNTRQEIKNKNEDLDSRFNELIKMSSENIKETKYIIWPESALPYYIFSDQYADVAEVLRKELGNDVTLLTGAIRIDLKDDKIFNSLFVFKDGKITDYYDKRKLVPFGEFIPFRKIITFVNSIAAGDDISKSKSNKKIIKIDNTFPKFSPIICYESIFNKAIDKKAKLIINITNDAWFGNTSGPYQHFDALKFRALENNIPVIRVANSGISGVIDRFGCVVFKTKLNQKTVIDIKIPLY